MRFGGKWLKGWKVIQRTNDYYHVGCDNRTFEGTVNTVVPPNTADLGTDEKASVFGNRRYLGGRL